MYISFQACTHFSFLRGVSSAEEMFAAAALLGYPALGIADRNSVGGLVKALRAADETGVRLISGCRLDLMDGTGLLVWPEDRAGWSRLTRLLTARQEPDRPQEGREGPMLPPLGGCRRRMPRGWSRRWCPTRPMRRAETALAQMADIFGERAHLALTHRRRPGDAARLHALDALARRYGVRASPPATCSTISPTSACSRTSSPRSATNARSTSSASAASASPTAISSAPEEMERRFPDLPDAVRATRRHRRALHLLAARIELPISRRDRDVGPHARRRRSSG